ncbi:MAG: hypothetical protein RLN75_05855 [Longimicrobiales bacterium]
MTDERKEPREGVYVDDDGKLDDVSFHQELLGRNRLSRDQLKKLRERLGPLAARVVKR